MSDTAMASAFKRAGISKEEMRAFATAQEFIQSGGTLERWMAIYRQAATKLSGGGHPIRDVLISPASARQPLGEATGRDEHVARFEHVGASPSSRGGAGQSNSVTQVGRARAVREPSASQIRAAATVAKKAAITVLDTYRVRDGRGIGDVRWGELERLRAENSREASVVRQILRHAVVTDHSQRVRDVIKVDELQRMIQRAAEVADAG